jgi:hypothetical protein
MKQVGAWAVLQRESATEPYLRLRAEDQLRADRLGFGRIAVSEIEAPNMFVNLFSSG